MMVRLYSPPERDIPLETTGSCTCLRICWNAFRVLTYRARRRVSFAANKKSLTCLPASLLHITKNSLFSVRFGKIPKPGCTSRVKNSYFSLYLGCLHQAGGMRKASTPTLAEGTNEIFQKIGAWSERSLRCHHEGLLIAPAL